MSEKPKLDLYTLECVYSILDGILEERKQYADRLEAKNAKEVDEEVKADRLEALQSVKEQIYALDRYAVQRVESLIRGILWAKF